MTIHNINYRTEPSLYSNRAIIREDCLWTASDLINGVERVSVDSILSLATLIEHAVLNERLFVERFERRDEFDPEGQRLGWLYDCGAHEYQDYDDPFDGFVSALEDAKVIDLGDHDFAAYRVNIDSARLANPVPEKMVAIIHGSHIVYEPTEGDFNDTRTWRQRAAQAFSPEYKQALKSFGLYSPENAPLPLLATCLGVPHITDPLYSLREVSTSAPTTIGIRLYQQLESLHEAFFESIGQYLGPTYVGIPSLLSIVLSHCSKVSDIPEQIDAARRKFAKFRKSATQMEIDLRTAPNIKSQVKIINAIDNSYTALALRASQPKKRVLYRAFDVIKHMEPIKMGLSIIDQAKEYDVEREALLKTPGYYDLWNASLEVEQALPLLERLFGSATAAEVLGGLEQIRKRASTSSPPQNMV
jgi:hypothetical protein